MTVLSFLAVGFIFAVGMLVTAVVGAAVSVLVVTWVRAIWMVAEILRDEIRFVTEKLPKATARKRWPASLRRYFP